MLVKICGITRAEDAETAVEAGANALGFVFWPQSPRWVDPYRARALVARLPPFVTPVGVFVNQPVEYVRAVANLVKLGAIQLHGDEDVSYLARLDGRPAIKAIGISERAVPSLDDWPARVVLLLDVHDPLVRGGTGRVVDWNRAAAVAARRRTLLAGGLTPDNVAAAVLRVQPFGIDVSSGLESRPGIKDPGRIRALFEALHGTGQIPPRP
jgi:phosphoribosylanthranilate isomerase